MVVGQVSHDTVASEGIQAQLETTTPFIIEADSPSLEPATIGSGIVSVIAMSGICITVTVTSRVAE